MQKELNKPSVLFIASNIPTPKRQSNKVVMTIAHKLSPQYDISVLHPAEWVPFPFNLMKKYRNIAGRQPWEDAGIVIKPFKYIRLFGKKNAFRLLPHYTIKLQRLFQQHSIPDVVHAHYALPDGYLAFLINKIYHVPYIISFWKSDIGFLNLAQGSNTRKLMDEVLTHAKHIIVHNSAQQEVLSNAGFKSILMAHGIEEDFFKPKESVNNTDDIAIASVGELIPQKHIDWVIKAVMEYKGSKNPTLKIAGEGSMRTELEALTNGASNIQLLGKIAHDKVGELLCQSDIFALPSINETFGLVYLEAAAHQNAVIATKGTGIWGHFTNDEEMFYCDSYTSFKEMLYKLIDDDEYRSQMAWMAYQKTRENFTWRAVIDQYILLYKS